MAQPFISVNQMTDYELVRRSRVGIVCPKHWRARNRAGVKLADLRHDKFLESDQGRLISDRPDTGHLLRKKYLG
jgi:hypothetical protein